MLGPAVSETEHWRAHFHLFSRLLPRFPFHERVLSLSSPVLPLQPILLGRDLYCTPQPNSGLIFTHYFLRVLPYARWPNRSSPIPPDKARTTRIRHRVVRSFPFLYTLDCILTVPKFIIHHLVFRACGLVCSPEARSRASMRVYPES